MKPGIYQDISNEDYHNSPECNALSAGGIKSILKTPAHFKAAQTGNSPTPAMIFGSAAHSYILTPQLGEVVQAPDINRRTKAGKEEWAEF